MYEDKPSSHNLYLPPSSLISAPVRKDANRTTPLLSYGHEQLRYEKTHVTRLHAHDTHAVYLSIRRTMAKRTMTRTVLLIVIII